MAFEKILCTKDNLVISKITFRLVSIDCYQLFKLHKVLLHTQSLIKGK
jgi:hypothetical protein